ncbi:LOW QUALITY PROTEIN: IQ domain-containing protein N [Diceros bicornis minor]|uniref:LOW QUALITY PROTEIN: IQ domain-containing protein N n=1 Tax=Diceros bicornis minor TaxID=77932 RepID=UPI0026F2F686|nr:LOW QUALITY PROTEIN: IQ domain-containing protein N [Diceros bicornis minor]
MTLQGKADLPGNQDNAASSTATVATQWAEFLPAPARPDLPDKAGTLYPQPQHELPASRETLLPQPDKDKTVPRRIPRLRAVVESQAFKNVLVDEMDMMLSRAATLIQANWRGYRLRQKLVSQMTAAKAIQEAWRRFSTRRLLRSGKAVERKVNVKEGDIPYHPPQQVRFQHPEEGRCLLTQPVMVSRETQFPSSDSLAACAPQLVLSQPQGAPQPSTQAPCAVGGPGVTFLPHQTITIRLPCPVSLDAKRQPCLVMRAARSACLVHHVEGDVMKTKQVTSRASKAGASGPPPSGRYAQAVHGPLKTQTQTHMETEVLKAPPQAGPPPVITKTPPPTSPAATMTKTPPPTSPAATMTKTPPPTSPAATMTKTPPPTSPAATMTKTPPPTSPAATMTKTPPPTSPAATMTKTPPPTSPAATMTKIPPQPCPVPMVTITKTPPQMYLAAPMTKTPPQTSPAATMTKTPLQSCLAATINKTLLQMYPAAMMTKTSPQPCPVPTVTITKTPTQAYPVTPMTKTPPQTYPPAMMTKIPPQPCPAAPMTKTPVQMRPTASMTNTSPQTRLVAMMTKTQPQMCPMATMTKTRLQTCPVATMAKTPPQMCPLASMIKPPTQTQPAAMMTKTPPQMCPMATVTKTPLQMCPAMAKTPSHTLPGASVTKTPPQTRLTAMITKTPAQLRSVAAILRTLCLPPPAAGNLKAPPPAAVTAAIPNTSSHTSLNAPKAKAVVDARQAAGMVKFSSHSYLTEGKVKYFPLPHLGAGAPEASARPPLEGELIKPFPQKQAKMETVSNTCVTVEMPRASSWAKVAEDGSTAHLRMDVRKVQSQVYGPVETAADLPPPQLGTRPAKALAQPQLATRSTTTSRQAYLPAKLTKTQSLAHLDAHLTKAQSQAHLAAGAIKVQSQGHLPTGLTKAQYQAQLVSETAKCLYTAHQAAELSSKTQSQPFLAGFKASSQPCQHVGTLGTRPRAKREDRLAQFPPHSHAQGKATQGPHQGASATQSLPVPLLVSAGHCTCNVESWGDGGAAGARPSAASPAVPCQEELPAAQLASLGAELEALLGSREDLRALLAKALSQGEARAALSQALSSEVLGTTMAKALSPGMLGTALVKVLSWGKLDIALSRTLSWGELQAKLAKATQGKLADALSKALTEEEQATLSQALCQGELGAVLSQSVSQAAPRTGVILPKATTKTARSGLAVMPTPAEVDQMGSPAATCGPTLGPRRPQPNKVRVPQAGAWEGFVTGGPARLLEGMGDGAVTGGSPCSSVVPVGASLTCRVITTIHLYLLIAALDPCLPWERGPSREFSLNLYLSSEISEESVCPHPRVCELASDLNPVVSDMGPSLPKSPYLQPPPSLWQPLIANGVGPSTSRPSVASGTAMSSHNPHMVSRVASHPWASSGQGRVAPGKLPSTVGGGRAAHSHQRAAAYGGPVCGCQTSRVSRVPPSVYRPLVAKGPQQPPVVPEEAMQKSQSLDHEGTSTGTREMINKVTSSPLRAAMGKVPPTRPRTPCDIIPLLLPGSVAPAHRWAPKTQVDPSLSPASTGRRLAPTLLRTATPGRERNQLQGTISGAHCPQELLTGHTLRELVASLPQDLEDDLARSFSQGSTDYSPNVSNSQSSLHTCSSHSLSTSSVASMTAVHLVEEASLDGDLLLDAFLSGEAMERSLGLGDVEETEIVGHTHTIPNLHQQPSAASKVIPILHHSSASSHMTLSVQWGSDGQADRDMSSGQRSVSPKESLSQKPHRTGLTRSLSSGNVVPTVSQQPSVACRLTPSLLQPSVASKVAPNPGQASMASGVTFSLSKPAMARRVAPSLGQPSRASGVAPSLGQPSRASGVAPSLGQPSRASGVAPSLGQPSRVSGVAPSLGQPSRASGMPANLDWPSMAGGVTPSQAQPSMTNGVALGQAQPSVTGGVAPSLSQASMASGVALGLGQPSVASGVAPSLGQPFMTSRVAPRLAQSSMTSRVAPRLNQSSMTSRVAPRLAQSSMTSRVAPRLAQSSMTSRVAPRLVQSSMTSRVAPRLAQSSMTSRVAPRLVQASMTGGVAPSLAQPSVATILASSRPQPSVISGKGRALSQPSCAPGVGSNPPSSGVNAAAPSLCHPSFMTEVPLSAPNPCVTGSMDQGLGQPSEAPGLRPCRDPLTMSEEAPHPQAPELHEVSLGFHEPLGVGGRCPGVTEHSAVTPSAPLPYQACVVHGEDLCLGRASSVSQGVLFRDVATCMPQGAMAAGMFLSMSQGPMSPGLTGSMCQRSVTTGMGPNQSPVAGGMAPIAALASVADAPLGHEQAPEVGAGFSWASVPPGLGMNPPTSLASVGPSMSQVCVDLPTSLDLQRLPVSAVAASGYQQASAFRWEPVMGTATGLVPCSIAGRMTTAVALGTVASGVAPSVPPAYTVNGVAQTLPPESMISGVGQGLPPGSMARGMVRTLPLGSLAGGLSPSLIAAPGAGEQRRSLPIRPSASLTPPSLPLGCEASGVGPSVSSGSVASSVVPAPMAGGLNKGLALGSAASTAGLPSTVGSVAQSHLQGSMLVGITPRPYHGALAGEGTGPFQAPRTAGWAPVHPQASEAGGTAKGRHRVPMVLRRASQLSQAPGMVPSETTASQAMMKPEDLHKALSQVSVPSEESVVLEDTPWMYHSPLATDIDYGHEFLVEDGTLPKGQRLLLEEVAPSKAESMTSGTAPVPPQPSSFAKHSIAGSVTPTLQQGSAISRGAPSCHSVAAGRVPSVQTGSVKGAGAPWAHRQASVAHVVPWSHSHWMGASPTVSGSPKLACGTSVASSLHPRSVARMGTPSTPRRSRAFGMAPGVLPYPSMASGAASGGLQMEAVPSTLQKPVSGDLAQSSHHKSLGPRKSYRSVHGSLVSEMLDDSLAKIVPFPQVREHARRSSQEGPERCPGAPLALTPILRTGEAAHDMAIPRPPPGVRRVSLGYESSPSGSWRPLFNQEGLPGARDFLSAVAPGDSHRASLTPPVLQGPTDAGVAGGQAWNSAVPSVAVGPTNSTTAPGGAWELARAAVPWDATGGRVAADPRRSGELVVSIQDVEKIIIQAVVTIQACVRGYLVRRTVKVWHQWAIIIQAAWRGYRVRRELARISRAATVIQAMWRGFCTRRSRAQPTLQPGTWAEMGSGARTMSDHRCFQSCQPHVCALCQSLSPGLGSPPSVVMLVGSSPRTCHMCGQTLPTRVVHGTGQGSSGQARVPWGCGAQLTSQSLQRSHLQNKAATTIQSAWRGFLIRRRLRQQQGAAKMLQATWRGHHARSSLTTDALLGPAAWDDPQHMQWPGV